MNVGIIGCGAAGMMAAITARKNGAKVTILEHKSEPGKKILSTGNGKCNFTNASMNEKYYFGSGKEHFSRIYDSFNIDKTIEFFDTLGIVAYEKNGYYYPRSEQASSVVECFIREINSLGIDVIYDCDIEEIRNNGEIIVNTKNNDFYVFDKLIICTGSNAAPKTGSDGSGYGLAIKLGHSVKKPLPSLCGLKCNNQTFDLKNLSGVRCKAKVKLETTIGESIEDTGELQHTDYGLSGIPIFQISGEALRRLDEGAEVSVIVDYAPEYSKEELTDTLRKRIKILQDKLIENFLDGMFNKKLCEEFIRECFIAKKGRVEAINNERMISRLVNTIKYQRYYVKGHRGFDNCQVCTGGIPFSEVKDTLESKIVDDVYFAGEILDIDGQCGGYNLQWAWSSGYVAGLLQ